jgi:hypothetical protein
MMILTYSVLRYMFSVDGASVGIIVVAMSTPDDTSMTATEMCSFVYYQYPTGHISCDCLEE